MGMILPGPCFHSKIERGRWEFACLIWDLHGEFPGKNGTCTLTVAYS
jgi:hypothetical protein